MCWVSSLLTRPPQAGFPCNLEQCDHISYTMPLYVDHFNRHKEEMKKRMICTESISKTAVCEQKFTIRRQYNLHQEEHRAVRLAAFQKRLRSVLLCNRLGLLLETFKKEYCSIVMEPIVPFKALGFSSTLELLQACPGAVEVQELEGGHCLLVGIPDSSQEHMARMIGNQRDECRGYDYRTGEVLRDQSHAVKKNILKVTAKRSRLATPFLRNQVERLLMGEEYQEGLDYGQFLGAYKMLYDYELDIKGLGFYSVEDLLHHGLGESVRLVLDRRSNTWLVFPLQEAGQGQVEELPQEVVPVRGWTEQEIGDIPTRRQLKLGELASHPSCRVCLKDLVEGEEVTALQCPCRQPFHPPCLATWLQGRGSCPACRGGQLDIHSTGEGREEQELDHVGLETAAGQGHREELPQELVHNIRELLAVRPQGLEVEALPLVYSQYGSLGRREPEELCVSLTLAGVLG